MLQQAVANDGVQINTTAVRRRVPDGSQVLLGTEKATITIE